jgi:two-component sensor histidine kinase
LAFQDVKEITSNKDFENFVFFFKEIDKKDETQKITSFTTKSLLYQSLDWAEKNGTERQVLTVKIFEISYLHKIKKYSELIKKGELLLKNTKVAELKDVVYMLQDLNLAYTKTEQYNKLLKGYTLYHNLLEKHKIPSRESSKNGRIAMTYYRLKNYNKARKYFIETRNSFIKQGPQYSLSSVNNNIGLCFLKMNQLDSAKFYFDKAISILDSEAHLNKQGNISFRKVIEENVAGIWVKKGNYNKALPIVLEELNFSKKQHDLKRLQEAFYEVANVYYLKHEYTTSLKYLDSVFLNLKKSKNINLKGKSLFLKGKTLLKHDQFDEADKLLSYAEKFKDSIEQIIVEQKYVSAAVKFETEKRELELRKSLDRNEKDKATKIAQKGALLLLATFLFFTGFFLYKTLKNKKIITQQKINAEKISQEKEILLKEVHHRVKNNLQVISSILELQAAKFDNKELANSLQVGQNRIQAMSLIHQQLYNSKNLKEINFKEYVETLISYIRVVQSKVTQPVKFNLQSLDFMFPISTAIPLGLIVNELITNAYKHAFVGQLKGVISDLILKNKPHDFTLIVADDGVGFSRNVLELDTLGIKLTQILSKQLGGNMNVKSNNGTQFVISFKDNVTV